MIYFFDSNVLIAYIYSLDPLNKAAKKAISKKNNNYYSEHVKEEVDRVSFRKDREYDKFLRKIYIFINKNDDNSFVDLSQIHDAISRFEEIGKLKPNNMHSAIEIIWDELGFDENTDAFKVKSNFNIYINNFHSRHRFCKEYCLNNMEYIPAYQNKDQIVLDKIKEKDLRENGLHSADEEILFDVHNHLQKNLDLDLMFVSGDKGFTKAISILIDVLAFDQFIYLEDFLNN